MQQTTTRPALELLGWDPSFERTCAQIAGPGQEPARVVEQQRSRWRVATVADGERGAVASGRLLSAAMRPAVGDWVVVERAAAGGALRIVDILPRRSVLRRLAAGGGGDGADEQVVAANVDLAIVLTALPGDLNLRRIERYVTLARDGGAVPVVVLTKIDLVGDAAAATAAAAQAAPGVQVLGVSALSGAGVAELASLLAPRRTAVLLGSSGVGKSTLLNRLLGDERVRTGALRADGRGRHTTSHRALFRTADGALVIDTPGMREVGLAATATSLDDSFPELQALARSCRFRDCAHDTEPGCAVRDAVAAGTLDAERLAGWRRLRREVARFAARSEPRAAAEEAARARMLSRSIRQHLDRKYGRHRGD